MSDDPTLSDEQIGELFDRAGSQAFLSDDLIEDLFDRASAGKLPVDASVPGLNRSRWLRTVDFTRPTKFSTDQERRLRRVHEGFCRAASTRLAAEHRIPLELEIIEISQLTWSDAHDVIPKAAHCATLDIQPIETNLLLGAELALLVGCIDRLLGSSIDETPTPRKLTEIDTLLVRRIFALFVDTLSTTWKEMAGVELELGAIDTQSESRGFIHSSEPCLVLTFEARLPRVTTSMALVVPYESIEPIVGAISRKDAPATAEDLRVQSLVRDSLAGVEMGVRAELAEVSMTVAQALALRPGDRIDLGAADPAVTLWVDDVPVHRARPGRAGRSRAVQIEGRIPRERPS